MRRLLVLVPVILSLVACGGRKQDPLISSIVDSASQSNVLDAEIKLTKATIDGGSSLQADSVALATAIRNARGATSDAWLNKQIDVSEGDVAGFCDGCYTILEDARS